MIYKQIKLAVVGLMALAIMPMVAEAALANSDSRGSGTSSSSAELFLGFGACPGAPCADVELSLDSNTLTGKADGFGFPLDSDNTGRLNLFALCVDGIFIGDDRVESTDRRVVEDDGVVDINGEVQVSFTALLGREVKIVDLGDDPPIIALSDSPNPIPDTITCTTGQLLLQGTVGFRNLR